MAGWVGGLMVACMLMGLAAVEAAGQGGTVAKMPMPVDRSRTADARWRSKAVLESRLLCDMESPQGWSHRGFGRMQFVAERPKEGKTCLRLVSPTKGTQPGGRRGRPWGECAARFDARGEDWTAWNRLSVWVRPHAPGHKNVSFLVKFHNAGKENLPGSHTRGALHYVLLTNGAWNHVAWEIPHLARDKVTAVEFIYRLQGNEPGAASEVRFDLDRLGLQKVEADYWEGWAVAPGRIAFSHTGYLPWVTKTAMAGGLKAPNWQLLDARTGKAVVTKPLATTRTPLGEFQVMDFSDADEEGVYVLRAGKVRTPPFRIAADVWRDTIIKTINHFFCQRCGHAVPGVHEVCHRDWQCRHGGRTFIINGGWHDAGDLSQGLVNTGEAVYAMFDLAEPLRASEAALSQRLIEEGTWGLDWVLKTRFGDGFRSVWATMDFWTDNEVGTVDDVVFEAKNEPMPNFIAAAAEARAADVLKRDDPQKATACLAAARDDWQHAVAKTPARPHLELASYAALASVEMLKATGEQTYADKAAAYARIIGQCQQRERTDWRVPLVGFFYRGPDRRQILHYGHRGHENAPVQALVELCEALPDHPDWVEWYATVVLHSEYLRAIARFTEPYGVLPASAYRVDESKDAYFQAQVRQGVELAEGVYLRRFPVWWDFRGNSGTVLSQAKALSAAARLRKSYAFDELVGLCWRQLEWHVGKNPFAQSLLYGQGHDYAPQYTATSGDIVGGLPVGIQTLRERDVPYWPTSNCYNYKEIWVHPSSRWLAIMRDLTPEVEPPRLRFISVSGGDVGDGKATLQVRANGSGRLVFTLRTYNLTVADPHKQMTLEAGKDQAHTWTLAVADSRRPWVAVVVPDGDVSARAELVGGFPPLRRP